MIVDSNDWTGRDRKAWAQQHLVERSRTARLWLSLSMITLTGICLASLAGVPMERENGMFSMTPYILNLAILAGIYPTSLSPFRDQRRFFGQAKGSSELGLPDEVETAIFSHYNLIASRILQAVIVALFFWLAFATAYQYALPNHWLHWYFLGFGLLGMTIQLPTFIAEWRVPFPPNDDQG